MCLALRRLQQILLIIYYLLLCVNLSASCLFIHVAWQSLVYCAFLLRKLPETVPGFKSQSGSYCGVVQLVRTAAFEAVRVKGPNPFTAANTRDGRVWLITVVLKTIAGKTAAGSNPALSALY